MKCTIIDGKVVEVRGCSDCPFFGGKTYFGTNDPVMGYCNHPSVSIKKFAFNSAKHKEYIIWLAEPIKKGWVCPLREDE